jgi:ElaB/YqjD/DUF883 family membrane-anchored ribosome-binding protein
MAEEEAGPGIWTSPIPVGTEKADEVLAEKNGERAIGEFVPDSDQEIAALRAEIDRLRGSIHEIASGSKRLVSAEVTEFRAIAEDKLKQNVFLSVGVAAFVGYLWGRTRR